MTDLANRIRADLCPDRLWAHTAVLSKLDRTSGTTGEMRAVDYITEVLTESGVECELFEYPAYLSYPIRANLRVLSPRELEIPAKTRAFSSCTPAEGLCGELVFVPNELLQTIPFHLPFPLRPHPDIAGKIVLSEQGGPETVAQLERVGAIAHIHLWGSDEDALHEGIVTSIWGTPGLEWSAGTHTIPSIVIKRRDGLLLKRLCAEHDIPPRVIMGSVTDTAWRTVRMPVAYIGPRVPFVLAGGHLDSWYVGTTDNATGNSSLLELARVFKRYEDRLSRGLRIAWWPGHSTGRYAGSTWYADHFWADLHRHGIAYVNADSPGSRGATDFSTIPATAEVAGVAEQAILEAAGTKPVITRHNRAGDQSFWGVGLPSLYSLLSSLPPGQRYAVSGSGHNWWWHTEYDIIGGADPDLLLRDTHVYALTILKLCACEILPFDLRRAGDEMRTVIAGISDAIEGRFDLTGVDQALDRFIAAAAPLGTASLNRGRNPDLINRTLIEVTRILVPLRNTLSGQFHPDPAVFIPPLPGISLARYLPFIRPDSDRYRFLITSLVRERNRLMHGLNRSAALLTELAAALE